MDNEYTYAAECSMCDVAYSVYVYEVDEKPLFCPMCGTENETEELE